MNRKTRWTLSTLPLLVLLAAALPAPAFARQSYSIDPDGGSQPSRVAAVSTGSDKSYSIDPDGHA